MNADKSQKDAPAPKKTVKELLKLQEERKAEDQKIAEALKEAQELEAVAESEKAIFDRLKLIGDNPPEELKRIVSSYSDYKTKSDELRKKLKKDLKELRQECVFDSLDAFKKQFDAAKTAKDLKEYLEKKCLNPPASPANPPAKNEEEEE